MEHTRRPATGGRAWTKSAGWLATAFGVTHTVVAPIDTLGVWSEVLAEGWWNTFTLEREATVAGLERSEAFWVTFGSFGVPMLILGLLILSWAHRGDRLPRWLGWVVLAWGVPLAIVLPAAPGWAVPVVGALLVLGERRARGDAATRPGRASPRAAAKVGR